MTELSILVKATGLLIAGLVAARLAGRARASVRHLILSLTFGALALLPLIALLAPSVTFEVPISRALPAVLQPVSLESGSKPSLSVEVPSAKAEGLPTASISWRSVGRFGILAGAIVFALPLVLLYGQLRRIHRNGLPSTELHSLAHSIARANGMTGNIEVLRHEHVPAPVTFGLVHPVVVMPSDVSDWSEEDLRRAFVHELEHIRRGDWAVQTMARLVCALYWFHPLAWIAWRQLGLEAERACDDAVVLKSESTDYAQQLVSLAHRLSSTEAQPMLGMANRSDLSARVTSLLNEHQARGRAGVATIAATIGAALLILATVAPVRAVAVTPEDQRQPKRSRALDRALFEAAEEGDLEGVNQLIASGANVNASIEGDGSPLIGAAGSGSLELVRRLVDAGADPNLAVEGDGSPLIHAAQKGDLAIATFLLDHGADVNQIVKGDENALMNAAEQGSLPVVQLLVKRGADVSARIWTERGQEREGEWRTAISQAQKNGHTSVVNYLLSVGARD